MICSLRQRSLYLFNIENLSDLLKLPCFEDFFFFLISAIVKNINMRFQNCNRSSLAFIFGFHYHGFRFYILIYY